MTYNDLCSSALAAVQGNIPVTKLKICYDSVSEDSVYCFYTKFGQLILRKIIKTVATRCQILRLKCSKIQNSAWAPPQTTPLEKLTALPRPRTWI